jgi:surface antigen/LysM repeat protein
MSKKTKSDKVRLQRVRLFVPYLAALFLTIGVFTFGMINRGTFHRETPIMRAITNQNWVPSGDEITSTFLTTDLADVMRIPAFTEMAENYMTVVFRYENAILVAGTTLRPVIIDTSNLTRGVIEHIVQRGETLADIASRLGVTTTQIRWSNNMRNDDINPGRRLYIPSVPGIVYVVRYGDTAASLAQRYQSTVNEIIAFNDLEISGLVVGRAIVIPNGVLPTAERPENATLGPAQFTPIIFGDAGIRQNMREVHNSWYWSREFSRTIGQGNPGSFGNCTWFAWYWRRNNMPQQYWLDGGAIGHAAAWVWRFSGTFVVNNTPRAGAVVQTSTAPPFGHVAIVETVHVDGSITIIEMNFIGFSRVNRAEISARNAANFRYIHQRR